MTASLKERERNEVMTQPFWDYAIFMVIDSNP